MINSKIFFEKAKRHQANNNSYQICRVVNFQFFFSPRGCELVPPALPATKKEQLYQPSKRSKKPKNASKLSKRSNPLTPTQNEKKASQTPKHETKKDSTTRNWQLDGIRLKGETRNNLLQVDLQKQQIIYRLSTGLRVGPPPSQHPKRSKTLLKKQKMQKLVHRHSKVPRLLPPRDTEPHADGLPPIREEGASVPGTGAAWAEWPAARYHSGFPPLPSPRRLGKRRLGAAPSGGAAGSRQSDRPTNSHHQNSEKYKRFLNTIHTAGKRRPLISIQSDIIIFSFSPKASWLSSLAHLSMARDRCRSMAWLRAPKYSAAPLGSEPQSRL